MKSANIYSVSYQILPQKSLCFELKLPNVEKVENFKFECKVWPETFREVANQVFERFQFKKLEVLGVFILKMTPTARLFWLENVADRKNVILGVFLQKSAWNFYRSWKRWYFIEWVKKLAQNLLLKGQNERLTLETQASPSSCLVCCFAT